MNRYMRTTPLVLILASLAITAATTATLFAQDNDDKIAMKTVAGRFVAALQAGDVTYLNTVLTDGYIYIGPSGRVEERFALINRLKANEYKIEALNPQDQAVHLTGDTSVVTGIYRISGSVNGRDISGNYCYMDVWLRQDGKWKAIASSLTKVVAAPVDAAPSAPAK